MAFDAFKKRATELCEQYGKRFSVEGLGLARYISFFSSEFSVHSYEGGGVNG